MYWPNLKSVAFPVPEIMGGTGKFWAVPGYANAPFFQNFSWAFIPMEPLNVLAKFEICSFPVPEILGGTQNNWAVPGYTPTLPFLQNFSWAIIRMDTVIVPGKFEVRSLAHSRDNSDWSFGWGANPQ